MEQMVVGLKFLNQNASEVIEKLKTDYHLIEIFVLYKSCKKINPGKALVDHKFFDQTTQPDMLDYPDLNTLLKWWTTPTLNICVNSGLPSSLLFVNMLDSSVLFVNMLDYLDLNNMLKWLITQTFIIC